MIIFEKKIDELNLKIRNKMSFLKELNDSHITLKAFALNVFLIPFWYVSIYLFNNEFFMKNDIVIILAMCITISLISCGTLSFIFRISENNKNNNLIFEEMGMSIMILCIWLSILIFSIYSIGFLFNIYIYFYWFLVIYFIPIIVFLFVNIISNNSEKK